MDIDSFSDIMTHWCLEMIHCNFYEKLTWEKRIADIEIEFFSNFSKNMSILLLQEFKALSSGDLSEVLELDFDVIFSSKTYFVARTLLI